MATVKDLCVVVGVKGERGGGRDGRKERGKKVCLGCDISRPTAARQETSMCVPVCACMSHGECYQFGLDACPVLLVASDEESISVATCLFLRHSQTEPFTAHSKLQVMT